MKQKDKDRETDNLKMQDDVAHTGRPSGDSGINLQREKGKTEAKTWCSYMEKGFRSSRTVQDSQNAEISEARENFVKDEISDKQ